MLVGLFLVMFLLQIQSFNVRLSFLNLCLHGLDLFLEIGYTTVIIGLKFGFTEFAHLIIAIKAEAIESPVLINQLI